MSNKPKGWKPLPGKLTTAFDEYCRRFTENAINILKFQKGASKHQGGKSLCIQYAAMHGHCNDN